MFNWGAIGQGVAGTIESGVGLLNYRSARKLQKKGERLQKEAWAKRTDFQIPEEVRQNIQEARNDAYGKPAIMQYMENAADQELSNNISTINRNATSGAEAIAAATGATQRAREARNQAGVAGAQMQQQGKQNLLNANSEMADYKSLAWDMNVNIPFLQRLQWAQDMIGTGMQGKNAGMNQFVQGQNQIGQSAANFFNMGGGMSGGGGGGM